MQAKALSKSMKEFIYDKAIGLQPTILLKNKFFQTYELRILPIFGST